MNLHSMIDNMSPEIYQRLKHVAETGRWPEGTVADENQKGSALQLVMAYQAKHLDSNEMLTVGADGEIVHKTKRELKAEFSQPSRAERESSDQSNIARFSNL